MIVQSILEGNKIIAEFLGINPQRIVSEMPINKDGNYCNGNGDLDKYGNPCYLVYAPSLQYNSSWDYLMPVVEKIESKGFDVFINGLYCRITDSGMSNFEIESGDVKSKIEAVWLAVVEFIKWYNSQKQE